MSSFVLSPSCRTTHTDLGKFSLSKAFSFKAHWRAIEKIHHKITPKPLRKVFSKKNFIKYAPILAAVAQILNVIPGLGIAVSLAIMAGAAALTVGSVLAKTDEQKKAQRKAIKDANTQANAAYDEGADYFQQTYNVTKPQFQAMSLDDKMNFLQVASEDADRDSKSGKGLFQTNSTALPVAAATAPPKSQSCPTGYHHVEGYSVRRMEMDDFIQMGCQDCDRGQIGDQSCPT